MYINKQSNIQKKDLVSTKTASGNPVVISDCAGGKARSLKTTIEAIQEGEGDPSPTNIRPISGRSSVTVDDVGKNQLAKAFVYRPDSASTLSDCFLIKAGNYTFSFDKIGTATSWRFGISLFDKNGNALSDTAHQPISLATFLNNLQLWWTGNDSSNKTLAITIVEDCYIRIWFGGGNTTNAMTATQAQLEEGDTATAYVPYAHSSATIQLGQTVYGADINWDTGVATVTDVLIPLDTGRNWRRAVDQQSHTFFYDVLSDGAKTGQNTGINCKCSIFKPITTSYVDMSEGEICVGCNISSGATCGIAVRKELSTVEEFMTLISGQTVCYKLATPTTLQLTPAQLEMLKGYNRVSIDNGSIELSYIPDNLAGDILSLVEEDYVKLEAVNTDPISVSGNPIVIQDAAAIKARSLKTVINAIQDLHGYDKPWAGGADVNKANVADAEIGIAWNGNENPDRARLVIPCSANTTYTISIQGTSSLDSIYVNDTETVPASSSGSTIGTQHTFTTGASSAYIVVGFNKTNIAQADINALKLQLELGSTKTSYRPYSNICPISGRTEARVDTENEDSSESAYAVIQLGQTVYGADINWDTGVVSIKMVFASGTWIKHPSYTHVFYKSGIGEKTFPATELSTAKSNILKTVQTTTIADLEALGYGLRVTDVIYVACEAASTAEEFNTWATDNGLQVLYELATPTTLQLTPAQLEMLKGYNRVTLADGYGTIELSYQKDNIAGDIASLTENELSIKADNSDISSNFELGSTASKAYSTNQFMLREDGLYKVTSNIASGAEITSSNTTKVTITEVLTALLNA